MIELDSYAIDRVWSLLAPINKSKFRRGKPTNAVTSEYIVINALPMWINDDDTQVVPINVNLHAKDIAEGVPDEIKINDMARSVLAILEKVSTTEVLIWADRSVNSGFIKEEDLHEHYINLRFFVRILNNY
ncbi:MAG: hypothetical protein AB2L20_14865 [Mangrovibacterium sp.]